MFENVVWGIVKYYAHKYVKGIKPEELRISLWQGHATMHNVELNTDELESLNLPLHVKRGFIRELCIRIPWTAILSDSVQVDVTGLVLEMIPNHQYTPSSKPPKENGMAGGVRQADAPKPSPYTSQLADRILENIKVNVKQLRMSFSDTEGSFPSVVHVSIQELKFFPSNASALPEPEKAGETCMGCAAANVDASWSQGPLPALEGRPDRVKEVIVERLCVYVQEVPIDKSEKAQGANSDSDTAATTVKNAAEGEPKKGESAEDWLLRDTANLHAVVKDVTVRAVVVTRDVPYTHLHFCKVHTADPIDFHLRDIDLQAFCLMMNELKAIFMKRAPRAAQPSPTDLPAAAEEDGGVVSWFGSAMDRYSSWMKGSQAEQSKPQLSSTPSQDPDGGGLEEFEPKELQLLLESKNQSKTVEAKGTTATTRLLFSFPSISCTLTQHVEFPVLSTGSFCVVPRAIVSLSLENFMVAREEVGKKVRMHICSESLSVRDLWTSNTLFPEIVGARAEMWRGSLPNRIKSPPLFHLAYSHNLTEGELPSMEISFEPLQVACPPLLVKRLAVFFDTALPKQHALFKRHPHLRKFHDEQAAATAEKNAKRGRAASATKKKVQLRVNVVLSALRVVVCTRTDSEDSDCVVIETTQVMLSKLPSDWQTKLEQSDDVFGSVPTGREVVRHVRITLRDLQVSTGTVSSVIGAANFVLVQPLTFEFLLTFSSSPDNAASSANTASAEDLLQEDEQPAGQHAQYICINCDVPRVNVSLAKDKLANVASVIGDLADTFSSSGGGVSQPATQERSHSKPPQAPKETLWRPLYGSSAPEESVPEDGSDAVVEPKLGRTFVLLAASCAEVSVLFVGTDSDFPSEEEAFPVYTPLVELQVRKLGAELSVYLNATTEKQVVRFATSLQSILLLDRMQPASAVIATVIPERSSSFFANDGASTPGYRGPGNQEQRQPDAIGTPLRNQFGQTTVGTPTVGGNFPPDYHFVSMTPSVVTLQQQAPNSSSTFHTPTGRQASLDSVERSSLFPGSSGILSQEHVAGHSRLSSAQDSAIRFRVVQLITPGVGKVPEVRARLNVSQLHASFTGTLVKFVEEFSREPATKAPPKVPSVRQRLRKLTQSQLLWQFAYLKMLAVMKQKIRHDAAEEGVPCLRFRSWEDYEAYAHLRPRQEHWLTFSTLSSYFQSVLSHLSITVNRAVVTLPGPSTVLSSTQMDVVVPKLVVHSAQQSGFSHGTLVLDLNVKQVHGYLSRFSNVQTSASLFDSSLDEAAESDTLQTTQGSFSFGDFDDSDVVFSKQDTSFLSSTSESGDSSFLFEAGTPSGYRLDGSLLDMEDVHMSMLDDQVALSKRKVFNVEQMACRIVSRLNRQEQSSVLFAVDGFVDGIHAPLCADLVRDVADIGQHTKTVFEQAHVIQPADPARMTAPLIAAPVKNAPGGGAVTCYNLLVKSVVVLCLENEEEVVRLKVGDMELIYSTHRSQSVNINGAIGSFELLDVQNTSAPQIIATITERPLLSLHIEREVQSASSALWKVSVNCTGYLVRYRAAFVDRLVELCRPKGDDRMPSSPDWPGDVNQSPTSAEQSSSQGDQPLSPSESSLALSAPQGSSSSSKSVVKVALDVTNVKIVICGSSPHVLEDHLELAGHFHFQRLTASYENDDVVGFTSFEVRVEDGRYTASTSEAVDFNTSNAALRLVDGHLTASRAHRESASGLRAPFPRCWYTTVTFTEPTAVLTDETLKELLQWLGTFSSSNEKPTRKNASVRKPAAKESSKQALTFSLRHPSVTAVADGREIFRVEAKRFDIHISSGVPSRENGTTFTLFQVSGTAPSTSGDAVKEVLRLDHAQPEELGWALQCELLRPQRSATGGTRKSTIIKVGCMWLDVVPMTAAAARLHLLVARAGSESPKDNGNSEYDSSPSSEGIRLEGTVASAKAVARLEEDGQELEMVALAVRGATLLDGNVLLGLDCSCERSYVAYSNPHAIIGQQMVLADMFGACCKLHQGARGQAVLYTDVDLIKLRLPLVEVYSVSQLLAGLSNELSSATGDVSVLPRSETLFTGRTLRRDSLLPEKNTLQTSHEVEAAFSSEDGGYRVVGAPSKEDVSITWRYPTPCRVTGISWTAAASSRATRPLFASLYCFNSDTQQYDVVVGVLPANTLSQAVTARMADLPSSCCWRLVLHPTDRPPCDALEPFPAIKALRLLAIPTFSPILVQEEPSVARPLLTLKASIGSVEMATMTMHTTDSPLFVLQCDTSRLEVKLARSSRGLTATGKASLSATLVYQDFHTLRLEEVLCAQPQASFSYTRSKPGSGMHDRLTISCTQPSEAPQLTVRVTRPLVQLLRNATSFLQHHGELQGTGSVGMFYHYRVHNCTNATLVLRDKACPDAADFVVAAGATRYFKWNLSAIPQQQRRIHLLWGSAWKSGELQLTNTASTRWFPLKPLAKENALKSTEVEQRMALVVTAPPVADHDEIHVSRVYDAFFCLSHKLVNETDLPLRIRFSHPSDSKQHEQSLGPAPAAASTAFATLASDEQQRVSLGVGEGSSWSSPLRLRDSQFASLIRCFDASAKIDRYLWLTVNRECMGSLTHRAAGLTDDALSFVVLTVSPVYQLVNQSPLPMHWRLQHGAATVQFGTVAAEAAVAFYCSPRKVTELFVAAVLPSSESLLPAEVAAAEQLEWSSALAFEGVTSREHHLSTGRGWVAPQAFLGHIHMYVRQTVAATIHNSRRLCIMPLQLLHNDTEETLWVGQVSPADKRRMLDCVRLEAGASCPYAFSFPNERPASLAVFRSEAADVGAAALTAEAALAVDDVDTILGVETQSKSGTYLAGYASQMGGGGVVNHQYVALASVEASGQAHLRILPPLILENDTSFGLALSLGGIVENAGSHASYAAPGQTVHLHHWASAETQVQQLLRCVNLCLSGEGWSWQSVDLSESRREALLAEDSSQAVTACAWSNAVSGEEAAFHLLLQPQEKGCLRLCFVDAPALPFRFANAVPHRLFCRLSTAADGKEAKLFSLHPGAALSIAAAPEGATLALRLDEQHTWSTGVPLDRPRSALLRLYGKSGSVAVEVALAFHGCDALIRFLHQPITDAAHAPLLQPPPVQEALPFLSIPDARSAAGMALVAAAGGRSTSLAGPPGGLRSVLELELPALVLGLAAEQEDSCKEVAQVVATNLRLHVRPRGGSAALDVGVACGYMAVRDGDDPDRVVVEWRGKGDRSQALEVDVTLPLPSCQLLRRLAIRLGPLTVALDDRFVRRLLTAAPRWLNALTRPTLVDTAADAPQQQQQQQEQGARRPHAARLCLCQVEISGWHLRVSWRNVQHVLPFQLPENLLSVSDLSLSFSPFTCDGRPSPVEALAARVAAAYRADVMWQLLGVVGAVDLLGNPSQLVRDVGTMAYAFCSSLPLLRPASAAPASVWEEAALLQRNSRSLVFGTAGSLATCAATFLFAFTEVVKGLECQLTEEFASKGQADRQGVSSVPPVALSLRGGLNDARVALERAVRQSIAGALTVKTAAGWISSCRAGLNVNLQLLLLARNWLLAANTLHPGPRPAIGSFTPPEARAVGLLMAPADEEERLRMAHELQALLPKGERLLLHCPVTLVTVQFGTRIRHDRVLALAQRSVLLVSTGRVTMQSPLEQLSSLDNCLDGLHLSLMLTASDEAPASVEMEFLDGAAKARFVAAVTQRYHQLTGRLLHHRKRLPELGLLQ